jgi:hypothetical protein
MPFIYCRRKKTIEIFPSIPGTTSGKKVSIQCNREKIMNWGIKITTKGIIILESSITNIFSLCGISSFENEKAAIVEESVPKITTQIVTKKLFFIPLNKGITDQTFIKLFQFTGFGIHWGGNWYTNFELLSDVDSIQKKGNTMLTAPSSIRQKTIKVAICLFILNPPDKPICLKP